MQELPGIAQRSNMSQHDHSTGELFLCLLVWTGNAFQCLPIPEPMKKAVDEGGMNHFFVSVTSSRGSPE